jgi:outer membrane lipoprotein-sorting protein
MRKLLLMVPLLVLLANPPAFGDDTLSNILSGIKDRYGTTSGLSVPYTRDVITRSMSMLGNQAKGDLASGVIYFKPPNFLRLDQEKPDPEKIIADGNILWWYIPQKKEAHRYRAEDFGKELKLLSDIFRGLADVRDSFQVRLEKKYENGDHEIVLIPDPPWQEINSISLTVDPHNDIRSVRIFNALGSVTRFNLGDFSLEKTFEKGFFHFVAPPDVKVVSEAS